MRLLIEISANLFEKIKTFIENGQYSSVSNFFSAAAENQLILEETSTLNTIYSKQFLTVASNNHVLYERTDKSELSIPAKNKVKTVEIPTIDKLLYPGRKEEDLFLWGQINRIFPLKVGLRVLANLLADTNVTNVKFEEFSAKASKIAQQLRDTFGKNKHITGKKDSFEIGLPQETEKSVMRYKNQFLGYLRKDNIIEGGLGRLKFANLTLNENKDVLIGITEPGLDFCILENPILDKNNYDNGSFSTPEKEFYLKHIDSYVPYEVKAFIDVLKLIKADVDKPDPQNVELKQIWPKNWSDAVINTQRNGVISRLAELGLVKKEKNGIEVEYKITSNGRSFLEAKGGKQ
jgi:hypothetical protein